MVQSLREILSIENSDKTSLQEVFSSFKSYKGDKDIESFLQKKAIPNEEQKISRTYLIINDEKWEKNEIQIDGYFSLALKVIKLGDISNTKKKSIAKSTVNDDVAAYLIGQLARGKDTDKGFGTLLLHEAIARIKSCQELVGGRIVYLDCKEAVKPYYEKQGFIELQKNPGDKTLWQMYRII